MLVKTMFIVLYFFFNLTSDLAITDNLRKNIFHNQISSSNFSGQLKYLSAQITLHV